MEAWLGKWFIEFTNWSWFGLKYRVGQGDSCSLFSSSSNLQVAFAGSFWFLSRNQLDINLTGSYFIGVTTISIISATKLPFSWYYSNIGIGYHRDGVSEGQFNEVLLSEMDKIRKVVFINVFCTFKLACCLLYYDTSFLNPCTNRWCNTYSLFKINIYISFLYYCIMYI